MMSAKSKWPSIRQKGITTVESTIVLGVVILLFFAILDGGRMIYAYGTVSHAAREGVRYAVVRGQEAGLDVRRFHDAPATPNAIENHVISRSGRIGPMRVTTSWPMVDDVAQKSAGQRVTVTVEHDFQPVTPFMFAITLTSTASSVIHY